MNRSAWPLTAAEAATSITAATGNEPRQLRVFFEFMRGADEHLGPPTTLISREPAPTGAPRFDALLAAGAEHLCARSAHPVPPWTTTASRFLHHTWWPSDLPSAQAYAAVGAPASFRRRSVYLDRHDLTHDGTAAMQPPPLRHSARRATFERLAADLASRDTVAEVHVAGGAAMLLSYRPNPATRDVTAVFDTDQPTLDAAQHLADEFGYSPSWLATHAIAFVCGPEAVFDHPHLRVMATPPHHLLTLKVLAARHHRDIADATELLDQLKVNSRAEVLDIVRTHLPAGRIPARSRRLVDAILAR